MAIFAIVLALLAAMNCSAVSYTLTNSGAWNVSANWNPNGVPTTADTAIVATGKSITGLGGTSPTITTLTIQGTGTLTVDAGTLIVSGVTTVGSSGAANLTISSGATFTSTSTASSGWAFGGTGSSITNNGTFNCSAGNGSTSGIFVNNGTATFTGSQQSFNNSGSIIQGANAVLNINSSASTPFGASPTLTFNTSGNTVSYGGTTPNIKGATYNNLTIATSGNPGNGGALTVNGTLKIATTTAATLNIGALTLGNSATIIRALGTLNVTPTFPASPNFVNVIYANTNAMTTGNELPANIANLTITNTTSSANKVTLNTSTTVNGTFAATYLTTPTTSSGATVLTAASGKTVTFSSSPVTINLPGSTIAGGSGSGSPYTVVSGGSTFVSGTLGTITVQGAGAPASSSVVVTGGQLLLGVGPTIYGAATATAFTTTYGTASANQSFNISGVNLTDDLVATAGTGFEVATSSGGPYSTSVSFAQSSGSASGTVFVRLAATATASTSAYNSVNAIVLSSTGANNANIATPASGNSVNKRALTFTGSKTYDGGTSTTAAQLAFANNLDGANLTMSGSVTLSAAGVGSRTISSFSGLTLGGSAAGNYTLTGASGSVTVGARALTFTGSKTYDANASATAAQLSFGNSVDGANLTMSGSVTLSAADAGLQSISSFGGLTLGGSAAGNYTLTGASGSVTVGARALTFTGSKTYDGSTSAVEAELAFGNNLDGANLTMSGNVALSAAGAGSRTISSFGGLTLGGSAAGNYTLAGASGSVTVNPKVASVTADAQTKTYGDVNPVLTAVTNGTVNGDVLDVTLATDATQFSSVGVSNITVTAGSNPNYALLTTNSTLTISPKDASVTADAQTKTYGEVNPVLTAVTNGTVNGDILNVTLTTDVTQFSSVGVSNITVTAGSNPNYTVLTTNSTLTIGGRLITVTAQTNTKDYDGNTSATNVPSLTSGTLASGDGFATLLEVYADAAVGTGKTLIPSATVTNSASADVTANYAITFVNDLTGVINSGCSAPVIVGGIDASGLTVTVGSQVILTITNVTGSSPLAYQWLSNSVAIADATNSSYTNFSVTLADAGNYQVVVTNACGSVTSSIAVLNVYNVASPAQISIPTNGVVNISFYGVPNNVYVVQTTTNLSVPWWPLITNTASLDGSWLFTDSNATNAQQYYRITQP